MNMRAIRRTAAGLLLGLLPLLAVASCGDEPKKHAWSADDEYPMAAVLRMPCVAVPGFVSGSGLRNASSREIDIAGVEVFAQDHGWTDDDKDERYLRDRDAVAVVTHRTGTECKVYVHT